MLRFNEQSSKLVLLFPKSRYGQTGVSDIRGSDGEGLTLPPNKLPPPGRKCLTWGKVFGIGTGTKIGGMPMLIQITNYKAPLITSLGEERPVSLMPPGAFSLG